MQYNKTDRAAMMMNFTPKNIHDMSFKKSFRGFSEDHVNEVLDKIIEDYSHFARENSELKGRLALLNESITHYKNIEDTLKQTLQIAQQTGDEIRKNAQERAEIVIKEAEVSAGRILSEKNREIQNIKSEYEDIKKRLMSYRAKVEVMLCTQLDLLKHGEDVYNDIV